jgi:hypothetical protein
MNYKYLIFKDSLVVNFGDKTVTIHKDDPRHEKILEVIASNELEKIPNIADNESIEEIRNLLKIRSKKQ